MILKYLFLAAIIYFVYKFVAGPNEVSILNKSKRKKVKGDDDFVEYEEMDE